MSYHEVEVVRRFRIRCRNCKDLDAGSFTTDPRESWARTWTTDSIHSAGEAEEASRAHIEADGNYCHEVEISAYDLATRSA